MSQPAPLIELKCRNCGSALRTEDISPQLNAARCHHCHSLFALPTIVPERIARPEVILPKGFSLQRTMDGVEIRRRWFGAAAFFLLFFAVFWNGFLLVWHGMALSQGLWFMSAFGLIHTGVGVFLIYYVAALFFNTTTIRATSHELVVTSGPLPWKGNRRIARSEVVQLFCREKVSHGRNGSSVSYSVEAVLTGNRRETLAQGFSDADHAQFVEQQLEKELGLADVPVAGEFGR